MWKKVVEFKKQHSPKLTQAHICLQWAHGYQNWSNRVTEEGGPFWGKRQAGNSVML